ncbi:unnamed protein product [Debaryomyces tyrocola]|nr:unnamed protein product [Debaryomyces tyrocola]
MGRPIEEVRGEGPIRFANEANAVLLTGAPEDYYHDGTMKISHPNRIKDDQYQRTPRSCCEKDGLVNEACNIQAENIVLYVSLFTKANQVESMAEIDDEGSIDENMSNDEGDVSEYDDEDGNLTGSCHEDEALSESWSSIFSNESNNNAPKSVSSLHYLPKKSVSDSNISPVNIPFDGSLKPDMLATDSLLSSLNKDMRTARLQDQKTRVKGLAVSNFARAFRVLKTSIHRTSYSVLSHPGYLSPRMTDDAVPGLACHERADEASHLEGAATRECASGNSMHPALQLPGRENRYRGRDSRMNSSFLRLYAIDYEARCRSTLPCSYSSRELSYVINKSRATKEFHRRYNIISVSNMSRDKLWDNVILPPRIDDCPCAYIDSSSYVYVGDNKKRVAAGGGHYYTEPAGVLSNSRCFYNDQSPQGGNTKLQYTVKGWCNSRWLDCSKQ